MVLEPIGEPNYTLPFEKIGIYGLDSYFYNNDFWNCYCKLYKSNIQGKINTYDFKSLVLYLSYFSSKQHIENITFDYITDLITDPYKNNVIPGKYFDYPIYMNGKYTTFITKNI